ncbi:ParA family protein [Bacillus sp. AC79A.1]|uniref:ParA family protein n=1 Tax=Bacillus wiedmannii TaxID=1890302 RepID=UPI000BFDFA33|nr:ParA family protein [Bacillus wiedmannii]PHF04983.1 chromosome partitioning protein [Bacillus wiedmannii]
MGKIISFGIQKGGVGKTTTTAITSFLLSQDSKVLAVDFDSQGNLTNFLTQQNIYDFTEKTVLQALKDKDPRPYIHEITDNLHILTAEDFLSTLPSYLYREYKGKTAFLLKETLEVIKDKYDYILIDLPPNLGDHTVNGLTASDYAVVILQSEPFCYDALDRYLEFLTGVQANTNPDLQLSGILCSMLDGRASLDASILERAKGEYEEIVFDSIIRRRSKIKEYTIEGLKINTKKDRDTLQQYIAFVKELKERVEER